MRRPRSPERPAFDDGAGEPTQTTEFDFQSIYGRDEGEDSRGENQAPTRDEAAAWLKAAGLSTEEAEIVLLRCFEKQSLREIAEALGMSRSAVHRAVRSSQLKACCVVVSRCLCLESPLPVAPRCTNREADPGKPLSELLARARATARPGSEEMTSDLRENLFYGGRQVWKKRFGISEWLAEYLWSHEREVESRKLIPELNVAPVAPKGVKEQDFRFILRFAPHLLLDDDFKPFLAAFVDLLEAASYGASAARILPTDKWGARGTARNTALKILRRAILRQEPGGTFACFGPALGSLTWAIGQRVRQLQQAWQATLMAGTRRGRLESFREQWPGDLDGMKDNEAFAVLTGDLLAVACRLASNSTGLSPSSFRSGYLDHYAPYAWFRFHEVQKASHLPPKAPPV